MSKELIPKNKKLTIKQQKFVEEYVQSGNGTQAAIDAGYSEKTGYSIAHENLRKPDIVSEVHRIQHINAMKAGLSIEKVLGVWKHWMEKEDQPAASLKASEFIAKYLKMFDDEKSGPIKHEKILKQIEELRKDE